MTVADKTNWNEVQQKATDVLSRYIRIDTTNPPGNEDKAAWFLFDLLSEEEIIASVHESAAGRANLVARLSTEQASLPPLLLLHHMDVVPATNPDEWSQGPFDGMVRNGYVWGRGAIDDKGLGTIHLMAFLLLKRLGVPLKRDVIFMAVSDEEEGGGQGAQWMLENHLPDVECEYVWDEGGTGSQGVVGNRPVFAISVWEKRSVVVKLTAKGETGHGSVTTGSALDSLVKALNAIQGYKPDMRFNDVTREFFKNISKTQPSLAGWLMRHAETPGISSFMKGQVGKIPSLNAMLRDTVTATVVNAGEKANVTPDIAEATLDVRLLPDTPQEAFLRDIKQTIDDLSVTVEATDSPISAPPSPADSEMFYAMEKAITNHVPEAIVTPMQTPVATDSRFFRELGMKAYGLIPVILSPEELATIHGVDERISTESLTQGIKIALDVLLELCAEESS